jgi:hypothetical protein
MMILVWDYITLICFFSLEASPLCNSQSLRLIWLSFKNFSSSLDALEISLVHSSLFLLREKCIFNPLKVSAHLRFDIKCLKISNVSQQSKKKIEGGLANTIWLLEPPSWAIGVHPNLVSWG